MDSFDGPKYGRFFANYLCAGRHGKRAPVHAYVILTVTVCTVLYPERAV